MIIELFICMNIDLALNNLQSLICHLTKKKQQKTKNKKTKLNVLIQSFWVSITLLLSFIFWCPGYDTELHLTVRIQVGRLRNVGYPFINFIFGQFRQGVLVPVRFPSMGQIGPFTSFTRIIIIIIYSLEFFTLALADGLSLEIE